MKRKKVVEITMEGGVIQDVAKDDNIVIMVRDYGVDGVEDDLLKVDEEGNKYEELIFA